jgi:hypothetical protein
LPPQTSFAQPSVAAGKRSVNLWDGRGSTLAGGFSPEIALCEGLKMAAKASVRRRIYPPNGFEIIDILRPVLGDLRAGTRISLAAAGVLGR